MLCSVERLVLICSGVNKVKDVQKIIGSKSYYRKMDGTEVSPGEELCVRAMWWKLKRMCFRIQWCLLNYPSSGSWGQTVVREEACEESSLFSEMAQGETWKNILFHLDYIYNPLHVTLQNSIYSIMCPYIKISEPQCYQVTGGR